MKTFKLSDYKGKYFVIQDYIDPDDWHDVECGEMREDEITDEFLRGHVEQCQYYGIPAYFGKDKKLNKRIGIIYDILESLEKAKEDPDTNDPSQFPAEGSDIM